MSHSITNSSNGEPQIDAEKSAKPITALDISRSDHLSKTTLDSLSEGPYDTYGAVLEADFSKLQREGSLSQRETLDLFSALNQEVNPSFKPESKLSLEEARQIIRESGLNKKELVFHSLLRREEFSSMPALAKTCGACASYAYSSEKDIKSEDPSKYDSAFSPQIAEACLRLADHSLDPEDDEEEEEEDEDEDDEDDESDSDDTDAIEIDFPDPTESDILSKATQLDSEEAADIIADTESTVKAVVNALAVSEDYDSHKMEVHTGSSKPYIGNIRRDWKKDSDDLDPSKVSRDVMAAWLALEPSLLDELGGDVDLESTDTESESKEDSQEENESPGELDDGQSVGQTPEEGAQEQSPAEDSEGGDSDGDHKSPPENQTVDSPVRSSTKGEASDETEELGENIPDLGWAREIVRGMNNHTGREPTVEVSVEAGSLKRGFESLAETDLDTILRVRDDAVELIGVSELEVISVRHTADIVEPITGVPERTPVLGLINTAIAARGIRALDSDEITIKLFPDAGDISFESSSGAHVCGLKTGKKLPTIPSAHELPYSVRVTNGEALRELFTRFEMNEEYYSLLRVEPSMQRLEVAIDDKRTGELADGKNTTTESDPGEEMLMWQHYPFQAFDDVETGNIPEGTVIGGEYIATALEQLPSDGEVTMKFRHEHPLVLECGTVTVAIAPYSLQTDS